MVHQFEDQLDNHYRTFPFWNDPAENHGFFVLAAYDALRLALPMFAACKEMAWEHKLIEDGLSWCLRWVLTECGDAGIVSTSDTGYFSRAAPFLLFGATYQSLFDLHVAYAQGLVRAEVEPDQRIVRFSYPDFARSWINAAGISENWNRNLAAMPESSRAAARVNMSNIRNLAMAACRIENGRVVLSDLAALDDPDLQQLSQCGEGNLWIPIPSDTDLDGFSLAELTRFWGILCSWSNLSLVRFQLDHAGTSGAPDYFPTQVVDRVKFASAMRRFSGLGGTTTAHIIERLSFDSTNAKADIFLTPLIQSGGRVAWSPRVVIASEYQRNMLKSMARTPATKPLIDGLIGKLEMPLLRRLRTVLEKNKYQCKLQTPVTADGESGEIDVLAWTGRAPRDVLIIEAKYILHADDINEVKDLSKKLILGQTQAKRIKRILAALPTEQKRSLFRFVPWEGVKRVFALVINNQGSPNELYDQDDIPTIDMISIKRHLRRRDLKTPERFWQAALDRDWFAGLQTAKQAWRRIEVGEVRYDVPVLEA